VPASLTAQINEVFDRRVKDGVTQLVAGNSYKWFYIIPTLLTTNSNRDGML